MLRVLERHDAAVVTGGKEMRVCGVYAPNSRFVRPQGVARSPATTTCEALQWATDDARVIERVSEFWAHLHMRSSLTHGVVTHSLPPPPTLAFE